jgi:hypothetical protein
MSRELEEYTKFSNRMHKKFPYMFKGKYGGFCIGPGWYDLVETLCENIDSHTRHTNFKTKVIDPIIVGQVKEKLGGLRFYYHGGDQYIAGLVRMAEEMSLYICEECGNRGKQRQLNGRLIKTACNQHAIYKGLENV